MFYYSLNNQSPKASFKEATIKGQSPDKGLYFPETIPSLPKKFIEDINQYSKEEIAFKIIQPYVGDEIPETELKKIISETINFDFPLIKINDNIFSLELFHGPNACIQRCWSKIYESLSRAFCKKIMISK